MTAGIVLLPGDRAHDGGVRTLSLAENMMLPAFDRYWGRNARERSVVDRLIADFDVRPPRPKRSSGRSAAATSRRRSREVAALRPRCWCSTIPRPASIPARGRRSSSFCARRPRGHRRSCSSRPSPSSLRNLFPRADSQGRRGRRIRAHGRGGSTTRRSAAGATHEHREQTDRIAGAPAFCRCRERGT